MVTINNIKYLTIQEMVQKYGLTNKGWYGRIQKNKVRHIKDGGRVLIDEQAYVDSIEIIEPNPK